MGDDDKGIAAFTVHFFKDLYQIVEAPQIDPCLRLIEHGQRCVAGNDCGDLNPLQFPAGEAVVDIAVYIIPCAQALNRTGC